MDNGAGFAAIDWQRWTPSQRATLIFVLDAERILLIRKKRGLGAGKITGPGGRIDAGETASAGALRELREELGIEADGVRRAGELSFQFTSGLALHVEVFAAAGHRGVAVETAEAVPLWTPLADIPYEQMWADDRLWMGHLLAGRTFRGRFLFDGDAMLGAEVHVEDGTGES